MGRAPVNYYRIEIKDKKSNVIKFTNNFQNLTDSDSKKVIIKSRPLLSYPYSNSRYVNPSHYITWITRPGFYHTAKGSGPIISFNKNLYETTYVLWLDIDTVN